MSGETQNTVTLTTAWEAVRRWYRENGYPAAAASLLDRDSAIRRARDPVDLLALLQAPKLRRAA